MNRPKLCEFEPLNETQSICRACGRTIRGHSRVNRICTTDVIAPPPRRVVFPAQAPRRSAAEIEEEKRRYDADAIAGAEAIGEPSLYAKGTHYAAALVRWFRAGMPVRTPERAAECEAICRSNQCGQFDAESVGCRVCGCAVKSGRWAIASKTKMATERCPKGLW